MRHTAVIIGFENTTITVHESDGTFDVCVIVTSPPMDVELFASIDLIIQTVDRNASKDNDSCSFIAFISVS